MPTSEHKPSLSVKHILVQHRYEIEDVYKKLLADLSQFESLALKYSICSSHKIGGDLGNILNKKNIDEQFLEEAQSLKINEISKPFKTQYGFHIILRYFNYRHVI